MREFLNAGYHLFFFKNYTNFHRATEILMGIIAWSGVVITIVSLYYLIKIT